MRETELKILRHEGNAWVSWGYVISWPDGSRDFRNGFRSHEEAAEAATKLLKERRHGRTKGH